MNRMELYDLGIEEYEDKYKISKCGEIWSIRSSIYLKQCKNCGNHYKVVNLGRKKHYVHRLVAQTFLDNENNHNTVDHIDRDIENNNVYNLRWASRFEQSMNRTCSDTMVWTAIKNNKNTFFWEKVYHKKKYSINSVSLAKVENFKEATMKAILLLEGKKIPSPDKKAKYYGTEPKEENIISEDEK